MPVKNKHIWRKAFSLMKWMTNLWLPFVQAKSYVYIWRVTVMVKSRHFNRNFYNWKMCFSENLLVACIKLTIRSNLKSSFILCCCFIGHSLQTNKHEYCCDSSQLFTIIPNYILIVKFKYQVKIMRVFFSQHAYYLC